MSRRIRSSRLSRYAEKQSKKQFLLFGLGTIIIVFLLVQFAGVILGTFGNIIFGIRGEDEEANESASSQEFLSPPTLSGIVNATSSASIDIQGYSAYEEGEILLFINGEESEILNLRDNNFEFSNVSLKNGENTLSAKFRLEDRTSDFSQEYTIARTSEKPELEISNPSDGSKFTKADNVIEVSGKTDINNSVTVNGFRAIVDNDGNYSYQLTLNEGDNKIVIEASNEAGTKTSKEITVNYED